jgi:hypothetical protein
MTPKPRLFKKKGYDLKWELINNKVWVIRKDGTRGNQSVMSPHTLLKDRSMIEVLK